MANRWANLMAANTEVQIEITKDSMKNNRDGAPFAKAAAEGATLLFNLGTQEQKRERELELQQIPMQPTTAQVSGCLLATSHYNRH